MNNTKETVNVNSEISDVIVYLSGAQVTKKAQVQLEPGSTLLKFNMLPISLLPKSIQVMAEEGVTIQSVEHKINYLAEAQNKEEIEKLKTKLENLNDEKIYEQSLLKLCDKEEQFLLSNSNLAGKNTGLRTDELKSAAEFFGKKTGDLNIKRIETNKALTKLDDEIQKISKELGIYSSPKSTPVSEVTVNVSSEGGKAIANLSYYVNDAGWNPYYDIRANDINSNIQLVYKSSVHQNTNEDWKNVNLTLSTASPSYSGICPDLKPWYINFEMPAFNKNRQTVTMKSSPLIAAAPISRACKKAYDTDKTQEEADQLTEVNESMAGVEYIIKVPTSILSGQDSQNVDIITHSLPAKYHHFSVCKLEKEVFLLAAVREK